MLASWLNIRRPALAAIPTSVAAQSPPGAKNIFLLLGRRAATLIAALPPFGRAGPVRVNSATAHTVAALVSNRGR